MATAYRCGLSRSDLDDMTIGSIVDYIDEYIDLIKPDESAEANVREATQADFDRWWENG